MANRYPLVLNGTSVQELQSGDAVAGLVIGTDIQAYDADTAKYDDATANFTGTLQNGGHTVLTNASDYLDSTDVGSTVQAYDSNLTSFVSTFTLPTTDGTNGQVMQTDGSGNISFTTVSSGISTGKAIAMAIVFGG